MLDHFLRGLKDQLLNSIAAYVGRFLHPLSITALALGVGLIGVWLIIQQHYNEGLLCWLLNRILDGLDGAVARKNHLQSDLGGYLDIVTDFIIYALIPFGLVWSNPTISHYTALTLLLSAFYVNAASWMYLAAILEKRAQGSAIRGELTSVTMPSGLVGGTETIIFYCCFILWPTQLFFLFNLMSVLVILTIGQRVIWAVRYL